jgi:hypothetical protein
MESTTFRNRALVVCRSQVLSGDAERAVMQLALEADRAVDRHLLRVKMRNEAISKAREYVNPAHSLHRQMEYLLLKGR